MTFSIFLVRKNRIFDVFFISVKSIEIMIFRNKILTKVHEIRQRSPKSTIFKAISVTFLRGVEGGGLRSFPTL